MARTANTRQTRYWLESRYPLRLPAGILLLVALGAIGWFAGWDGHGGVYIQTLAIMLDAGIGAILMHRLFQCRPLRPHRIRGWIKVIVLALVAVHATGLWFLTFMGSPQPDLLAAEALLKRLFLPLFVEQPRIAILVACAAGLTVDLVAARGWTPVMGSALSWLNPFRWVRLDVLTPEILITVLAMVTLSLEVTPLWIVMPVSVVVIGGIAHSEKPDEGAWVQARMPKP